MHRWVYIGPCKISTFELVAFLEKERVCEWCVTQVVFIWSPHFFKCSPSVLLWNVEFFFLLGNFMKHFLFKLLLVSISVWTCHKGRVERRITKQRLVTKHPSNVIVGLCANGSKHIIRNQKGHQMLDIISQNQTFIFY